MPHARENEPQRPLKSGARHPAPYLTAVAPNPSTTSDDPIDLIGNVEPLGRPAKALFITIGWVCLSIGHIISMVPKLRATLFVIAAHWCFLQSSPRWQGWLYRHPQHGHVLQDWHHHQRVPKNIKASATITLLISASLIGESFGRLPLVAFGLFVCLPIACFLWTRPVTPD